MGIPVPDYLLRSALRHFATLADADIDRTDIKAVNAQRLGRSEIRRLNKILTSHKPNQ